tara:strand:- start:149415 stop:149861 length:447 start_codon:yes stop_codon:yes gene_type:complete
MIKVLSVASYILENFGPMTAMKLQKLVYYSQAWHCVWEEADLFDSEIQAWANGPVIIDLYKHHAGEFMLSPDKLSGTDYPDLSSAETESINAVCEHYSKFTAQQLSDKTHNEAPWIKAREGLEDGDRSAAPITLASMHQYYSGLSSVS